MSGGEDDKSLGRCDTVADRLGELGALGGPAEIAREDLIRTEKNIRWHQTTTGAGWHSATASRLAV